MFESPFRYRRGAKPRWGLFSNDRSEAENEHPPDERKEGDKMITYSDLIQFCIFIVALVGLCYEIFKGKRK